MMKRQKTIQEKHETLSEYIGQEYLNDIRGKRLKANE